VRIVTALSDLDLLADGWDAMLRTTPLASGFQAFGWVRACWDLPPLAGARPYVMVAERAGVPIGIAPMALSRAGDLSFIGAGVSSYNGPVVAPDHSTEFFEEWREHIASDPAIHSVDLAGLRAGTPALEAIGQWRAPGLGRARIVVSNVCPEVDLSVGWAALVNGHRSSHRGWVKKSRRLGMLGSLQFVETEDHTEIRAAMPELFALYDERWAGRWTSGAFSSRRREFQMLAAASGVERLSMLRLDDRMIACLLGIRFGGITTGYVLAHDDRFRAFSPGLLLMLRILEAAAERGDPAYDFSLGEMPYKAAWADRGRTVFRAFWGRGSAVRAIRARAWVKARSVDWLQAAKVNGPLALRTLIRRPRGADKATGLGSSGAGPLVLYRAARRLPRGSFQLTEVGFADMERLLPPPVVRLALTRHYRGDRLHAMRHDGTLLGFAWLAGEGRRKAIRADIPGIDMTAECWYHPIAADQGRVDSLVVALLATRGALVASGNRISDQRVEIVGRSTFGDLPSTAPD
jgi:CelD/BcsL family acetyltransferase involved in cellulose biosynthesis